VLRRIFPRLTSAHYVLLNKNEWPHGHPR
jgi:hypothetical protein